MAFKIGTSVMVVKYGHIFWKIIADDIYSIDLHSELVGKIGIVTKVETINGRNLYALDGIPEKTEWYDERQLKEILPSQEDKG